MNRNDWRRSNITAFVRSSPPGGSIKTDAESRLLTLRRLPREVRQLPEGKILLGAIRIPTLAPRRNRHDYLSPQVYWQIGAGTVNRISHRDSRWRNRPRDGTSTSGSLRTGRRSVRDLGTTSIPAGQPVLPVRCSSVGKTLPHSQGIAGRYPTHALIPPMPWKDRIPPLAPQLSRSIPRDPRTLDSFLGAPPPARDGDTAPTTWCTAGLPHHSR